MGAEKVIALPPELCRHWEIIEPPQGATSTGKCLLCLREKIYMNYKYADYYNRLPLNDD